MSKQEPTPNNFKTKAVAGVMKATQKVQDMELPIHLLIPNIATIVALCLGLSAVRFALLGKFDMSLLALFGAAFFDALDGKLARLLKAETQFGAQLDSLADFANFGIAPTFVLYIFAFQKDQGMGWTICLFFAICQSLRLARFNTQMHTKTRKLPANFFVGVPAPMGALVGLYPMILEFALPVHFTTFVHIFFFGCAGCLMISRIPTYSFKSVRVTRSMRLPILVLSILAIAALINATWITLSVLIALYIISIVFSWLHFRTMRVKGKKQSKQKFSWPSFLSKN